MRLRKLFAGIFCLSVALATLTACPPPPPAGVVYATEAPPPLRSEVVIVSPGPGYVWVPGYWGWGGSAYAWTAGAWAAPAARGRRVGDAPLVPRQARLVLDRRTLALSAQSPGCGASRPFRSSAA